MRDLIRYIRTVYRYEEKPSSLTPYVFTSLLVHVILFLAFSYQIKVPELKEDMIVIIPVVEKGNVYEIADIAKPAVEKRPKKARFLGMYDSSVDDETIARPSPKLGKRGKAGTRRTTKLPRLKKRDLYDIDKTLFAMKTPDFKDFLGEGGNIGPQFREDFYPDYKLGQHTYLNVLRYPDVDYFVRMKRQFKMTFNPSTVLRRYFLNNRVAQGSVEVALAVSVDKSGNLSELFILKSSGIGSYDHEAMRTVRASSPFASPPKKFLEDDGLLRMSWTFIVYL